MKRKIFAVGLSLVAAATVVGSGFSAWYFDNVKGQVKTSNIGATSITGLVTETGKFTNTILSDYCFLLDQGKSLAATGGISIVDTSTKLSPLAAYESSYTITTDNFNLLTNAGYTIKITYTVKIHKTLLKYATFDKDIMNSNLTKTTDSGHYEVYTFDSGDIMSGDVAEEASFAAA